MAKKENSNQDQEQDDIIELTDVVEAQSDDSLLEETMEDLEESEESGKEPEVSTFLGDEPGNAEETEASLSDDDLDIDALFEELDHENDEGSEGLEAETVETTLSPEDEGQVTGGIHSPDSEDDFDALLEDLDKSEDMLSSLTESEEEQPSEEETPVSSPQEPVPEEPEEDDIDDIPQMDEAEELEPEEPEGEAKPEMGPQPLEAEGKMEAELEPETLDDEVDEETELQPQLLDEETEEETELESHSLDEDVDAEIEPTVPEGGEEIDVRDLADRLERLENAQSAQSISEDQLVSALNELPSDAPFWSRIEERAMSIVESKVREYTQDMENRIAKLQETLDNLDTDNLVTRQTLVQEIREVKEELPSTEALEEHKQTLRQELLQEMESQIPAAAARVIREEIQNLRSDMEK